MHAKHLSTHQPNVPWNKGRIVGQKRPLKLHEVWAIRIRLQLASRVRDLALFDLAIDSKLRGCDLVALRVGDVAHGQSLLHRAIVLQRKTQRPVQFEITEPTRAAVAAWIEKAGLRQNDYLFPSRKYDSPICRLDSMHGSPNGECGPSIWILPSTAPIPCGAPKRP